MPAAEGALERDKVFVSAAAMCFAVSVSGVRVTHRLLAFEKSNEGLHVKHVTCLLLPVTARQSLWAG